MSFLKRVPLPMSALALGLAGLGNLLASYSPMIRTACGVLAAVAAVAVLARCATDTSSVRGELKNPAALAVMPTLFMAGMLLATYVKPVSPTAALILWAASLVIQLGLVGLFVRRFVVPLRREAIVPSWFLVFVGFVVATVTSPAFGMEALGRVLLPAGVIGYLVMLPLVVARLVKGGPLPAPALPTLAILAAPPSLCLVGYLAVTPNKSAAVVYVGLAVIFLSVGAVALALPRILGTPFAPTYAALTFPAVISATAVKQSHAFLTAAQGPSFLAAAVPAFELLAAVTVVYVIVRYAAFLMTAPAPAVVEPASA